MHHAWLLSGPKGLGQGNARVSLRARGARRASASGGRPLDVDPEDQIARRVARALASRSLRSAPRIERSRASRAVRSRWMMRASSVISSRWRRAKAACAWRSSMRSMISTATPPTPSSRRWKSRRRARCCCWCVTRRARTGRRSDRAAGACRLRPLSDAARAQSAPVQGDEALVTSARKAVRGARSR